MSYGQQLCGEYLARLVPAKSQENARPAWLGGLELDFYYPDHKVAVEFNGGQHYFATGLSADPLPQKIRDARKLGLCKERGITLIRLKAIDLFSGKIRMRLKRHFTLNPNGNIKGLDKRAKEYRKTLVANFACPTAHRAKGKARQKTVARLFSKHAPNESGKWNNDIFRYKLGEWIKAHGMTCISLESFEVGNIEHLRRRSLRQLAKDKAAIADKKERQMEREASKSSVHQRLNAEFDAIFQ